MSTKTMSLLEQFEQARSTPSDIYQHLDTFVALVDELDAVQVIELGTRTGVSTIAWLYALAGRGQLTSVDLDPPPNIGQHQHWRFVQGDDLAPNIYGNLPGGVDIVLIDTSHEYEHTFAELSLYRWLVRPGGRILLHDTELAHPEFVTGKAFPVRRAIEDFCTVEGLDWSNDPKCFGLGTVVIP